MSHVTRMNESCHTNEWVTSHKWMSHEYEWVTSRMDASRHTYEWVTSHVWISHVVTRTSHVRPMSHLTHSNSVLQRVAACCSVLQCVKVLQCAAVCCISFQILEQSADKFVIYCLFMHINESCHTISLHIYTHSKGVFRLQSHSSPLHLKMTYTSPVIEAFEGKDVSIFFVYKKEKSSNGPFGRDARENRLHLPCLRSLWRKGREAFDWMYSVRIHPICIMKRIQ